MAHLEDVFPLLSIQNRGSNSPRTVGSWETAIQGDIWDINSFAGISATPGNHPARIHFSEIPDCYREASKRYLSYLLSHHCWNFAYSAYTRLRHFLAYFSERYPDTNSLRELTRADMANYVVIVNARPGRGKNNRRTVSGTTRAQFVRAIGMYIYHLQRSEDPIAPRLPVERLIFPEECRSCVSLVSTSDQTFSPVALRRLEDHLDDLPEDFVPVIILLRASGWRISDILNLRWDTCLSFKPSKTHTGKMRYWLKGRINKTNVENHTIPIKDDVAEVVEHQIFLVRSLYDEELNPDRWLFPTSVIKRQGFPISSNQVRNALIKLVERHDIRDEGGASVRFKLHGFRHTLASEFMNAKNPMPPHLIANWLAHRSLNMTLHYAKVRDETKEAAWIEAMASGMMVYRDSQPVLIDPGTLSRDPSFRMEEMMEMGKDALALDDGYCLMPVDGTCDARVRRCYVCQHFGTTPEFLPQFLGHRQRLKELIVLGTSHDKPSIVRANSESLRPVEEIISVLETGQRHYRRGDKELGTKIGKI